MLIGPDHVVIALQPLADLYDGDPATDVFNMEDYDHITFLLFEGAGGTGTATLTVEECNTAAGGGANAIAYRYRLQSTIDTWGALTAIASTGYTTVAGANKAIAIEVDAEELADGFNFVRLQITEVANDPCTAVVIVVLSRSRYKQHVPVTAIA